MSDGLKFMGKYNAAGDPLEYIPGVPARNLDGDELKRMAEQRGLTRANLVKELTANGLYEADSPSAPARATSESGTAAAGKE